MTAYYNEIDPYAAQWLRNLITKGRLPKGDVDERSIVDVRPSDLRAYRQCHFFAGIGGWAYALRLANWPNDKPVWTGSCPCQPLSVAGQRRGHVDERHLWPAFYRLIAECRPATVFGEQVASKDGREWLAAVRADLEAIGYACGCADLPAAGVGAPHIRQRLWWVGHSERERSGRDTRASSEAERGISVRTIGDDARSSSATGELADAASTRRGAGRSGEAGDDRAAWVESSGLCADGVANAERAGLLQRKCHTGTGREADGASQGQGSGENSPWSDLIWLPCADGKARPTQPIVQCMADGISYCLGQLCPEQEQAVIDASETSGLGREVLSALREGYDAAEVWQSLGRCIGFSKATLLFSALCQHERELGHIINGTASNFSQTGENQVRAMRQGNASSCSSFGWQLSQQRARQFADVVHSLSLEFTSLNRFTGSPLANNVPGRVGRLRAYGNAIVPQVAVQFIKAATG